jgi:hypothetical protein
MLTWEGISMTTIRCSLLALTASPTTHKPLAIFRTLSRTVAVTVFLIAAVPIQATAAPCLPLLNSFVAHVRAAPGNWIQFMHTTNYQTDNYWGTGHSGGSLGPGTGGPILSGEAQRTWQDGHIETFSIEFYPNGQVRFAGQYGPYATSCFGGKFLTVNTGDSFETFTFALGYPIL